MFLEISQNSHENNCARFSLLIKLKFLRTPFNRTTAALQLLRLIYKKKCIVAGLTNGGGAVVKQLKGIYCKCGINQYAVQKPLKDDFGASLLLLELGCLRYAVLPYHFRMLLVK